MGAIASQITSLTIGYLTVYSGADHRKHQSPASLAFVLGIHRWPVNSLHNWPATENISIWWRHHDQPLPWWPTIYPKPIRRNAKLFLTVLQLCDREQRHAFGMLIKSHHYHYQLAYVQKFTEQSIQCHFWVITLTQFAPKTNPDGNAKKNRPNSKFLTKARYWMIYQGAFPYQISRI